MQRVSVNPIGQLIPKFYSAREKKNSDKCLFEQGVESMRGGVIR